MDIPTEDDWHSESSDPDLDLDTAWAYKHFHGKTHEEAVRLFEEDSYIYEGDLLYMPSRVFGYYLKAYIEYLMSDAANDDSVGASSFVSLIAWKAERERADIIPLWPEIELVLKKLAKQQNDVGDDWTPRRNFWEQACAIVQREFNVSFDTVPYPEIVPKFVSLQNLQNWPWSSRALAWPVAVQLFHNSGISQVDATSGKPEILRIFGPPDHTGDGERPEYCHIPDWICYNHPQCLIRFEFDGDLIASVTLIPALDSTLERPADRKKIEAFAAWDALFDSQKGREDASPPNGQPEPR